MPKIINITALDVSTVFILPHLKAQVDAGHDVEFICSPGPHIDRIIRLSGSTWKPITINQKISLSGDVRSFLALFWHFQKTRPDLVIAHMAKAGYLGMLAARLTGVPSRVYYNHGLGMLSSQGVKKALLRSAEIVANRCATHSVFCGESTRQAAIETGLVRPVQAKIIGHGSISGIDTERFSPGSVSQKSLEDFRAEHGIKPESFTVLFVGRLARHKGLETICEAWRLLQKDPTLSPPPTLLLAAYPEDAYCLKMVKDLEKDCPFVQHLGVCNDMPLLYRLADVLILPSWYEGLPYSVLEAQSMKIPCIVSNVTGNVDAVVDGQTGLVIRPRNPEALAEAVLQLGKAPSLRQYMGRMARERVCQYFSQEKVIKQALTFYEQLLLESL
ncbi:MAG: glycosyltransferase family 4 protein [Phycisphaerae bacterium]|nr:glycosyltransferase family 4 protein [Phycisphaerae bacterium]